MNVTELTGDAAGEPEVPLMGIEVPANALALMKLPVPVKPLVALMEGLEQEHGEDLYMMERPKGWLSFFKAANPTNPKTTER